MELVLEPTGDDGAAAAVQAALLGERLTCPDAGPLSAWWRAGLAEALDRAPAPARAERYDTAPSPRSTRGAIRA